MTLEITIFQEISVVVFASITFVTAFYFQVARKLENKTGTMVDEKIWLVERELITVLVRASGSCVQKIAEYITQKVGNEAFSSKLTEALSSFDLSKLLNSEVQSSVDTKIFTKEIVEKTQLSDEIKDQLYDLTFMSYGLKNAVPEKINYQTDQLLKGIIYGIIFGMLVPFFDVVLNADLGQYSFLSVIFAAILLLTGYFYIINGIIGVWKIRQLEKKIIALQKEKIIEEIRDIILDIMQVSEN